MSLAQAYEGIKELSDASDGAGQVFSPVRQVKQSDGVGLLLLQLSGSRLFTAIFTSTEEASDWALLFSLHFLLLLPFPSSPERRRQIKYFLTDKTPQEEQCTIKKGRFESSLGKL